MKAIRSIITAFCMFSRIPMPQIEWKDENMRYMLAAFPLVGAVVGAACAGLMALFELLAVSAVIRGASVLVLMLLLTGGIHMDGFADTMDALSSHAPAEKKRAILKDPHSGAFAVISVCAIMILDFALLCEIRSNFMHAAAFALVFVLSRSFSGLFSILFPASGGKGLLSAFRESAEKRVSVIILAAWAVCACIALFFALGAKGLFLPLGTLLAGAYLYRICKKEFGGMSGDLSGWYLTVSETLMLAILCALGGF